MLNYSTLIDFYKTLDLYDKDYFEKIQKKTFILDDDYNVIKDFIGFYPKYDDNNNLVDFKLYLPHLDGLENILIYVHEYAHALFPDDEDEIFPNIVEAIFLKDYLLHDKYIEWNIEKTKKELENTDSENHIIGKKVKLKYLKER